MNTNNNFLRKSSFFAAIAIISPCALSAQQVAASGTSSYFSNSLFNTLLTAIIILLFIIVSLSNSLKNIISSDLFVEKLKKDKAEKETTKILGFFFIFLFSGQTFFAAEKVTGAANDGRIGGLDPYTFYILLSVIILELIVMKVLMMSFNNILGTKKAEEAKPALAPKVKTIFDKLNDTVELEQEESILLDHNYDGIRELDNNLPPWWKYGFYLTILIGVIYLFNYHMMKISPLQKEEYAISVKKAEADIAQFMKTSANAVDENSVKLLTSSTDVSAGKDLFITNCATCHGKFGEGGVGPNMTDDYWLHGGSVKDIFKVIKYGWTDKGMKSWKEDFSPVQMAQIASFIRTLRGTNPPKQKEKQGDLYVEQIISSDTASIKKDSLKLEEPPKAL